LRNLRRKSKANDWSFDKDVQNSSRTIGSGNVPFVDLSIRRSRIVYFLPSQIGTADAGNLQTTAIWTNLPFSEAILVKSAI
jgi:hypothetical protein